MANDNGQGLGIYLMPFMGADNTADSKGITAWSAYSSTERTPDFASTWWTTNDATFEITGLQLEVGPQATAFEHRSFADELLLCQRYYAEAGVVLADAAPQRYHNNISLPVEMRALPTRTAMSIDSGSGGNMYPCWDSSGSASSKRQFYQSPVNNAISNAIISFDAEL